MQKYLVHSIDQHGASRVGEFGTRAEAQAEVDWLIVCGRRAWIVGDPQ